MADLKDLSNLLVGVSQNEVNEVVKAEDLGGERIDWDSKFFEPEVGKTYMSRTSTLSTTTLHCRTSFIGVTITDYPTPSGKARPLPTPHPRAGTKRETC